MSNGKPSVTSLPLDMAVSGVLSRNSGYASLSSVAKETGLNVEELRAFFSTHAQKFRKSLIRGQNGEEVYLLNTPMSRLADLWKAFRDLNAKKY